MRRAYQLVGDELSHDTIECLERLLAEAKAGKIIGIAVAGILRRQHYVAHICGSAGQYRVFTRGVLRELDDKLSQHPSN